MRTMVDMVTADDEPWPRDRTYPFQRPPAPEDLDATDRAILVSDGRSRDAAIEQRIGEFVDREHHQVVTTIALWCSSVDDATEAVTDAMARAWELLARGATIDNFAAWVTSTAMNDVRARHRHRSVLKRKRHLMAADDILADHAEADATLVDLRRALASLTQRQREVIALHYGLDLSVRAVADHLGVAEGTIKATLHQSRQLLAERLGDEPTSGSTP